MANICEIDSNGRTVNRVAASWSGAMTLGVGWAWLDARIGDNRPHRHIAHQISVAIDDEMEIQGSMVSHLACGEAMLIPASMWHSIGPVGAAVRTIYFDPLLEGIFDLDAGREFRRLLNDESRELVAIKNSEEAKLWAMKYSRRNEAGPIDGRLANALLGNEAITSPRMLAKALGLSASRLREIVVHDFGVPPTKLVQWLQLQRAIDALSTSYNLADAAAAGNFADQAHFTRRLVEWFGVTPSAGLSSLDITIVR